MSELLDIGELAKALTKAQGEMTNPPKSRTVNAGKYSYSYAELDSIIDHVRATLAKHGLSVVQRIITAPESVTLNTLIIHESGQYIDSSQPLPRGGAAQEFGSYLTYARRYSLCAILGIAAESDDDARGAGSVAPGTSEDAIRDELVEHICEDSVSNIGIVTYCKDHGLFNGPAKTADDIPLEIIKQILADWKNIAAEIKNASNKKAKNQTPVTPLDEDKQTTKGTTTPTNKPKSNADDKKPVTNNTKKNKEETTPDTNAEFIPVKLRTKLDEEGITPETLKTIYVSAGHFPDTVEPCDLPDDYVDKLTSDANWPSFVAKANKIQ